MKKREYTGSEGIKSSEPLKSQPTDFSNIETGLFKVNYVNKWMDESKKEPIPLMLFDTFWYEGELCFLFADTNQGKSILAVGIANSISSGKPIKGFEFEAKKQAVLYFDFELSAKQFEARYSVKNDKKKVYEQHFKFDNNFIRVEIDINSTVPVGESFETYIFNSLIKTIEATKAKVIIIDNLTYLKSELERSNDAGSFVKNFQLLIDKFKCSILILAHTPKRDLSKPITRNDLQGSKRLIDFADSAFTIGESKISPQTKYIKQIKVRQSEFKYDPDNVAVGILKKTTNFLQFEFSHFSSEQEHISEPSENKRLLKIAKAKELNNQGKTQREIAQTLGISLGTVNNYLKENQLP